MSSGNQPNQSEPSQAFDTVYQKGLWGKKGGGSGPGSDLIRCLPMCISLARFLDENSVDRIVDVSCGAMAWWPTVLALSNRDIEFEGYDISSVVIEANKGAFRSYKGMSFKVADASNARISDCDFIMCRETINHLPMDMAVGVLENIIKSKSRFFCLSDESYVTQNAVDEERSLKMRGNSDVFKYTAWNLALAPFELENPVHEIMEYNGRSMKIYRTQG